MEHEWDKVVEIYGNNPVAWSLVSGVLGASIVVYLSRCNYIGGLMSFIPNTWRDMMAKKARRELVRQQATYDFVNAVMERVDEGVFTNDDATELYRDLKKCFPIPDLYASPEKLKEDIQKRLKSGLHAPVPLPLTDLPVRAKHAFDKVKTA